MVGAGLEASDRPGGRVRTDVVDGLLLDRGFQLLNPSYPQARHQLDLDALRLQAFQPGVAVLLDGTRKVLADPLRWPAGALDTLRAPVGTLGQKAAFAAWATRLGVLADPELETTSRRVGELFLRSFVRGTPGLPVDGMQAIGDQLAARLPAGTLRVAAELQAVSGVTVRGAGGVLAARAVLVACDPTSAGRLLDRPAPPMRALTTFYYRAQQPPTGSRVLHLDGDRSGPVVNTAVVSNVAPSYASGGRSLIASTVLGVAGPEDEPLVRDHVGRIYGVEPSTWEHVATYPIREALPAMGPGQPLRQPVDLGDGLFVAGDHRDP